MIQGAPPGYASLPARRLGERRIDRNQTPRSHPACFDRLLLTNLRDRLQARCGPPIYLQSETARWKRRVPRLSHRRHAPPCAAPPPVFGLFTQPGFDGIVFNVGKRVAIMLFVTNVPVERVALPKLSRASKTSLHLFAVKLFHEWTILLILNSASGVNSVCV